MATQRPPRGVLDLGAGFWNIRGSYKIRGIVELGTHCSLVRLASGRFVFLDMVTLDDATKRWVDAITDGGAAVEAVLNLHPFHTMHVRPMHAQFPDAKLYGTARHHARFDDLPWEPERTEDEALHARYADDLAFTVPRGVDFVADDPSLHFASVLAFHGASRALHVDDTLLYIRLPKLLRVLKRDVVRFHPTLAKVLQRRAGAADEFRAWAEELVERAADLEHLCAAHSAVLSASRSAGPPIAARIEEALAKVEGTLAKHRAAHG